MARKLNELKYLQDPVGHNQINDRRSNPQFVPCYVPFQPQPRAYPPKRRLEIAIEVRPDVEIPSPVKITHTAQDWDNTVFRR